MAINALDERHKTAAELVLRGLPRYEIAKKVGIHRSTLNTWMQDPVWLAYYGSLERDMEGARAKRLAPLVAAAAEALKTAVNAALRDYQAAYGTDPDASAAARLVPIPVLTDALKKVTELERVDSGQPSSIRANVPGKGVKAADPVSPEARRILDQLDGLATPEGESPNTSTTADDEPPPEVH